MKACLSNSKLSRAPLESIKTTISISSPCSAWKELNRMMVQYPSGMSIIDIVQLRQMFPVEFYNQQRVHFVFSVHAFIYKIYCSFFFFFFSVSFGMPSGGLSI